MKLTGTIFSTNKLKEQKKRKTIPYEFKGLNWMTDGGSCLGDLVVIVGDTGIGKSTLATQIVGSIWKKEGYKTLIYSGEMDETSVIRDLSLQQSYEGEDESCFISPSIDLEAIEWAASEGGYKVILVDNLMTITQFEGDLNISQSLTVKKLKGIAQKFNCLIFLICHPNKTKEFKNGENLTINSINGTSNIGNLANLILGFNKSAAPNERILEVLKNRKTGQLGSIKLKFTRDNKTYQEIN